MIISTDAKLLAFRCFISTYNLRKSCDNLYINCYLIFITVEESRQQLSSQVTGLQTKKSDVYRISNPVCDRVESQTNPGCFKLQNQFTR